MRLTKPSIISSLPIPAEKHDIISTSLGQCNKSLPNLGSGKVVEFGIFQWVFPPRCDICEI